MPIKDLLKEQRKPGGATRRVAGATSGVAAQEDPFMNPEDLSDWKRIPGLFRKWEFADLIEDHDAISFERAGETKDGTELWALYRHLPPCGIVK